LADHAASVQRCETYRLQVRKMHEVCDVWGRD
jgi:hypothetical protein